MTPAMVARRDRRRSEAFVRALGPVEAIESARDEGAAVARASAALTVWDDRGNATFGDPAVVADALRAWEARQR